MAIVNVLRKNSNETWNKQGQLKISDSLTDGKTVNINRSYTCTDV